MKKIVFLHGYNGVPVIFEWAKNKLESLGFTCIMPVFPKQSECDYKVWKKILNDYKDIFDEQTIVIAHSMGNILMFKFLAENNIKINLYIGLAGFCMPFEVDGREDLNKAVKTFFPIENNEIEKVKNLIKNKYSIYSDDDHIVPFEVLKNTSKIIKSNSMLIPGIGHMGKKSGLKELPEILEIIKKYY